MSEAQPVRKPGFRFAWSPPLPENCVPIRPADRCSHCKKPMVRHSPRDGEPIFDTYECAVFARQREEDENG
jgi:hypothetical protein